MASTKIRGITIELGADTSGISSALKSVNTEIGSTQRQLKDVERLLKMDPGNIELLAQKQRLLNTRIGETKTKLDTLREAQKEVGKSLKDTDEGRAQYDALTREIQACEKELKDLEDQAGKANVAVQQIATAGGKIKDLGGKISQLGSDMTRYVTTPIAGAGVAITKIAGDFEAQMAKVSAVAQAYGGDLEKLRENAIDLSNDSKFSATEIAQAYEYMGMAGWKTDQILKGTPGIIDLAAASGEDLASVSDIVTDGLTAFGLKAEDTARFVNVLAEAARSSNTDVGMMGESFKYVAPVAGSMGYSVEDVGVALGLMANSGIKASLAGTSLRNMMQRMAKPTKESANAMNRLGLSIADDDGKMYSFRQIMDQVRKGMGEINMPLEEYNRRLDELDGQLEDGTIKQSKYDEELEELNKQAFGAEGAEKARAAAMLGGTRAMAGLMAVASATEEDYNNLTNAIDGSSDTMAKTTDGAVMPLNDALREGKEVTEEYEGTAAAMAGVMGDTTNTEMQKLGNQTQNLAIELGETLLPMVRDVVAQLSEWAKEFQNLSPETQQMIIKIGLLAAAIGPLLLVVGQLMTGIGSLMQMAPMLSGLASFIIANPIALLIAAVIALYAAIALHGDKIQDVLNKVDAYLQNIFTKDWTKTFGFFLAEPLNAFLANVRAIWNGVKTIMNGVIDFVRGVFTGDWKRALEGIKEILKGQFELMRLVVKAPLNSIIGMINTVIGAFNTIGDKISGFEFDIPEVLGGGHLGIDIPRLSKIPYLAKGGILSQGSAIVGEAGAELLTMSNGRAVVQPLTNNTNNYAGATNNFYIQSNDPYAVAEQVSEILDRDFSRQRNAFA